MNHWAVYLRTESISSENSFTHHTLDIWLEAESGLHCIMKDIGKEV
jgi:hypothetical protein